MPTGYTSDIYNGKEVSGKEFILKCARSFGALVTMRDDPMDKEITKFEPRTYHLDRLKEEQVKLEKYKNMTIDEVQKEIDDSYEKEVKRYYEQLDKYNRLKERYEKTLKEVEGWTPPTDEHVNLKNFAIEQLKESVRFDCDFNHLRYPIKECATEWLDLRIISTEDNIKYHRNKFEEEVKVTNERNEWVNQLKGSLN